MTVRPIPKHLLIHQIIYKEYVGSNGWDGNFSPGIPIQHVRVDPVMNVSRKPGTVSSEAKHIVFVDRSHSTPYPDKFLEQSKIEWNGKEYELVVVKPLYDTSQIPHHYELELK